jgi:hypothetical protein
MRKGRVLVQAETDGCYPLVNLLLVDLAKPFHHLQQREDAVWLGRAHMPHCFQQHVHAGHDGVTVAINAQRVQKDHRAAHDAFESYLTANQG